jgi:hypothetical protein
MFGPLEGRDLVLRIMADQSGREGLHEALLAVSEL